MTVAWDNLLIKRLQIISPHLDDAVFSLSACMQKTLIPISVLTVFTHADQKSANDWAQKTGFTDAFQEYEARREEDKKAMALLGIDFTHVGMAYGCRSEKKLDELLAQHLIQDLCSDTLTLLPLGAGRRLSKYSRIMRRILRIPAGAPPHPDHVWVRDVLMKKLSVSKIGYYAEIPYHFANSKSEIYNLAGGLLGRPPDVSKFLASPDEKLHAAMQYRSQVSHIFGRKTRYQRKLCGRPEIVFF